MRRERPRPIRISLETDCGYFVWTFTYWPGPGRMTSKTRFFENGTATRDLLAVRETLSRAVAEWRAGRGQRKHFGFSWHKAPL